MKPIYYILENGEPRPVQGIIEWGEWFENVSNRIVAKTFVGGTEISTVFLGIDHRFVGDGPPVLFETMVFGGHMDGFQERCCNADQAKESHERTVNLVKSGIIVHKPKPRPISPRIEHRRKLNIPGEGV